MSQHSSVDRETFQQLLASAYAVQESQISRETLSLLLEVQRSVASGKLDLDGAMHSIVESARHVANASGVAIGLLTGDRLTYRAASGTSSAYVGQRVTASLTGSSFNRANREILRVEDAQTDTRIEADICRQFEANALLILPIYLDRVVAGVLDIRFSGAHTFQDSEVCTYRLMAEQIERAIFHAMQIKPEQDLAVELPSEAAEADLDGLPFEDDSYSAPRFWMGESSVPSFFERCQSAFAAAKESPRVQRSVSLAAALVQRAKQVPVNPRERYFRGRQRTRRFLTGNRVRLLINTQRVRFLTHLQRAQYLAGQVRPRLRNLALVAAAALVAFTGLIAYKRHTPASSLESSALPKSTAPDQPESIAKPLPGTTVAEPEITPTSHVHSRGTIARKRVRLAGGEVQYFGDDVTVRTFSPKPAVKRPAVSRNRVTHFGSDVTVRYFAAPQPAVHPAAAKSD